MNAICQYEKETFTNLVYLKNDEPTTSSVFVADFFGKKHYIVTRKIQELISQMKGIDEIVNTPYYEEKYVVNPQNGETYLQYEMNRDGFTLLAMGFTGDKALKYKLLYIAAFNEMEKRLTSGPALSDPRADIAKLILKSSKHQLSAIKELYPEYFALSAPINSLEATVDRNTTYTKWIEDYNITAEWIGCFPTNEIYNSYKRYCVENFYPCTLGKKEFYATLAFDFNLATPRQRSDGKRYFLPA